MEKKLSYTPEELADILANEFNNFDYCDDYHYVMYAGYLAEMALQGIDVSVEGTRDMIFNGCVFGELEPLRTLASMGADVKKYYNWD